MNLGVDFSTDTLFNFGCTSNFQFSLLIGNRDNTYLTDVLWGLIDYIYKYNFFSNKYNQFVFVIARELLH